MDWIKLTIDKIQRNKRKGRKKNGEGMGKMKTISRKDLSGE
jgi:hypothetical protein